MSADATFVAPPDQRYCTERWSLSGGGYLKCDRFEHQDDNHFDADEDLFWSPYPPESA